jgi:hypothetical protein
MITCGLCITPRLFLTRVREHDGSLAAAVRLARSDDGRQMLVHLIAGTGAQLVLAADQLRQDPVIHALRKTVATIWLVPPELVAAVCAATGSRPPTPSRLAGALAAMPALPGVRGHLRRLLPVVDSRQLALL